MTDGYPDGAVSPAERPAVRRWLPLIAGSLAGFVLLATIGTVTGWLLAGGAGGEEPDGRAAATTEAGTPAQAPTTRGPRTPDPEPTTSDNNTEPTLPELPAGQIRLPDLVGTDFREARDELRGLGLGWQLRFGAAGDDPSVYRTDPAPGKTVKRGATVKLSVVGMAPIVTLPDLGGLSCARAVADLIDLGLYPRYATGRIGVVVQQEPAPASELRWNDRVRLHCASPREEPSASPEV